VENSASLVGKKLTHPFPPHAPNLHTHTEYTLTHTLTLASAHSLLGPVHSPVNDKTPLSHSHPQAPSKRTVGGVSTSTLPDSAPARWTARVRGVVSGSVSLEHSP
jgi:hypothetical protein